MEIFQPFGVGQYQSSMGWVIAVAFARVGASEMTRGPETDKAES